MPLIMSTKVRMKKLLFATLYWCWAVTALAADLCPHPAVPFAATYSNVSGGADQNTWKIKYACDGGYELFGDAERSCNDSKWKGDLPHCAVNVALGKPAEASSTVGGGVAANAVDGKKSTVHEGNKCTETKSEKSPWWTVDLLDSYPVKHVRLTTRCCDDMPVQKAEIRVGNSTTPGSNPLCNWIPKALEQGSSETLDCYEDLVGRYVSIVMTGVDSVLSLCEVEVFSTEEISVSSCSAKIPAEEASVFQGNCYDFLPNEVSGYDAAKKKCEETGFHLMAEVDELGAAYLKSRLSRDLQKRQGSTGLMAWLGAEREPGSGHEKWNWVTGGPVGKIDWGKGQPNNYNQEQNCAVLDSELDWKWNDISCKISAVAVCQGSPARCPSPLVGEGSYYSGERTVAGTLSYHCPLGEMPVGETNITCQANGEWSGGQKPISCKKVDCGQVPGLADGEIHVLDGRTTWGARVRYKCKDNYSLMEGDETRSCQDESGWSGKAPKCVYTKCSEPPAVANSTVEKTGGAEPNTLGAKIVYTCNMGNKATGGELTRECLVGGVWSGEAPKCEFVDCGAPPPLDNGKAKLVDPNGRTSFGASVEYSCDADYNLLGQSKQTCEATGKWSKDESVSCEIIQCPTPRAPSGGRVSGYDHSVHSKIEFSCLTGHVLEGQETLTCTREADWSSPAPICRFVDCGALPAVEQGTVHYVNGSTHLGSVARYACDRSHTLDGNEERVCEESGQWSGEDVSCSEIRCPMPTRPENTIVSVSSTERLHGTSVVRSKVPGSGGKVTATVSSYRVGSTLKYRCERGFTLEADVGGDNAGERVMTRRCTTAGEWTGSDPACKFVDCGPPEKPLNSDVTMPINGTYYGSVAFYKCNDHFKLDGFEKRRCESDGTWKPEAPNCTETLCPPLTEPANGHMVLTTLRIGGRATFTCDQGYSLKGDDDIECLSSGSWSSWSPGCIQIDCGQPDNVENGRLYLTNGTTIMGSVVEYHCFPGYDRSGPFERICGEDGYWSGVEPNCAKPKPVVEILASDNTVDGTKNVRAGTGVAGNSAPNVAKDESENNNSSVGTWIGVTLGLIVVVGLLILGVFFYRKQRALAAKPPPYSGNTGGTARNGEYIMSSVYGVGGNNNVSGSIMQQQPHQANPGPAVPARIGALRPPPPIQMYGIDEAGGGGMGLGDEQHRGPIYDTINDDSSSSGYSRSQSGGSDKGRYAPTSFGPPPPPTLNGFHSSRTNGGFSHDYDVPEGLEQQRGAVTINGIAV